MRETALQTQRVRVGGPRCGNRDSPATCGKDHGNSAHSSSPWRTAEEQVSALQPVKDPMWGAGGATLREAVGCGKLPQEQASGRRFHPWKGVYAGAGFVATT